jgi:two-component system chemotaxis sensor kinase CheA
MTLVAATEGRLPPAAPVAPATPGARLGEILVQRGTIRPEQMATALEAQQTSGLRLGEQLVAEGMVKPKEVAEALRSQKASTAQATVIKETIRIDVDRVDSLVEMIGELVIVQSLVSNMSEIQSIQSLKARTFLGQLTKITRDLQSVGLRMRMMPVRGVFQKMSRMVHDLSRKSGKEVRIVLNGEDVEMDRGMVDLLGDPLVHMIRNSIDHGIEAPEDRAKTDKPAVATVRLSAFHECGNIAIEVTDDGRGLNRDAILAKARAQGMVPPGPDPSDQEIFQLIFAPGFSTAKQVTEISGRGVGMDVVKRQIESMRGRVMISSTPGRGASFKLVLPLTLAIIDGMLIACGEERYIIPTLSIVESIQPQAAQLFTSANRGEILNLRGEILPLVRLDKMLDIPGAKVDPTQALVVVLDSFGHRLGLVVDDVLTKQQVVIKSLGAELQGNHFVSGAAILGDGRVGFILNVQEIGRLFGDAHRNSAAGAMKSANAGEVAEA